jgi:nucleotide-binding universal stress UspA family protein
MGDLMFNNVIAGVDELGGGRDAIALAAELAADSGRLTLAYIYGAVPSIWTRSSALYDAEVQKHGLEVLRKAASEADLAAELRCCGSFSIGRGLHELAESIDADLLVVGSSQHGAVGRVLLGDDTRAALDGAPCAVAIAPAGYANDPRLFREIGVGYDGSPESIHALAVAGELAVERGARLSAFEAVSVPAVALASGPASVDDCLQELLDDARARVSALDGVEAHAVYGQPAEELAMFSASVDLLVVGSRGYGPLGRLVHGSTSHRLARMARCPLLVLPRAAESLNGAELSVDAHGSPTGP